jgi:hypothetical protein
MQMEPTRPTPSVILSSRRAAHCDVRKGGACYTRLHWRNTLSMPNPIPRPGGYDTPEQVAMEGFPPQYCRVVASRSEGDEAYVLLDTGSPDRPYLYGSSCRRIDGRWFEVSSSKMGGGWEQSSDAPELGTLSLWGQAPQGAVAVRLNMGDEVIEEPITNSVYLIVRFNVPAVTHWPAEEFRFGAA